MKTLNEFLNEREIKATKSHFSNLLDPSDISDIQKFIGVNPLTNIPKYKEYYYEIDSDWGFIDKNEIKKQDVLVDLFSNYMKTSYHNDYADFLVNTISMLHLNNFISNLKEILNLKDSYKEDLGVSALIKELLTKPKFKEAFVSELFSTDYNEKNTYIGLGYTWLIDKMDGFVCDSGAVFKLKYIK